MRTNSDSAIYDSGKAALTEWQSSQQQRTLSDSLTPSPLTPVSTLALAQRFPFAFVVGVAGASCGRAGSVSDSIDLQHIRLTDSPVFAPSASLPLQPLDADAAGACASLDLQARRFAAFEQQLPAAKLETSGSRLFQRRQPHASTSSTSSQGAASASADVAMETSDNDNTPTPCPTCDKISKDCNCMTSPRRKSDDDVSVDVETVSSSEPPEEHLLRTSSSPELRRHSDSRLAVKSPLTSSAHRTRSHGELQPKVSFK